MKFVFDLDGTICFKGKPLSQAMIQALDTLVEKGHEILFASARPIRDLLPILPLHMQHYSMIGGNGAFVAKDGEIVSTVHFDQKIAETIFKLIKDHDADYLIDSKWDYAYRSRIEHPIRNNLDPEQRAQNIHIDDLKEIVKVVILNSKNECLLEELQKLQIVIYEHGQEGILDISPIGIDKWAGLQKLGIEPHDFIAFGNDANDVSMFKYALRSVCVGDHEHLVQIATDRVNSNEEDVIRIIAQITQ